MCNEVSRCCMLFHSPAALRSHSAPLPTISPLHPFILHFSHRPQSDLCCACYQYQLVSVLKLLFVEFLHYKWQQMAKIMIVCKQVSLIFLRTSLSPSRNPRHCVALYTCGPQMTPTLNQRSSLTRFLYIVVIMITTCGLFNAQHYK